MRIRNDLLDAQSPADIEVIQLTDGSDKPSCHVYMEAQIFTPDSKRFVLHESAHAHGSDRRDPKHRYLVCDLENECALYPLTEETGATAPSVSPDGKDLYYFVNETELDGGSLTLKRVALDGTGRETLFVLDGPIPGSPYRASRIYPLSTVRSDGKRLALSCFLSDHSRDTETFGLMVFDLEDMTVQVVLEGAEWCNIHPQYCRSTDPEAMRDILVQENHGCEFNEAGQLLRSTGGHGADVHVIRDDGRGLRNLPWGRDGNEFCQGHQCWRGRAQWAITSTDTRNPRECRLVESEPVEHAGHVGLNSPGGIRNHLSRSFPKPCFFHFATDVEGKRLISDTGPSDQGGRLFIATLGIPGEAPLSEWTYLVNPRSSWKKTSHIHPFLSPDGSMAFFNSDETGLLQAYMIQGLNRP